MPQGITRGQIYAQIPKLRPGSFDYFVLLKAGIKPIGEVRKKNMFIKLYPHDCIDKIKQVMGVE